MEEERYVLNVPVTHFLLSHSNPSLDLNQVLQPITLWFMIV